MRKPIPGIGLACALTGVAAGYWLGTRQESSNGAPSAFRPGPGPIFPQVPDSRRGRPDPEKTLLEEKLSRLETENRILRRLAVENMADDNEIASEGGLQTSNSWGSLSPEARAAVAKTLAWLKTLDPDQFGTMGAEDLFAKDRLELCNLDLEGTPLELLQNLSAMGILKLDRCRITPSEITKFQDLFRNVPGASLSLGDLGGMTAEALSQISSLRNLSFLSLGRTDVADAALAGLEPSTSLTALSLDQTSITGEGFDRLPDSLQTLSLKETNVTPEGLGRLGRLKSLNFLILDRNTISDEGLLALASVSALEGIKLNDTSGYTEAGLARALDGLRHLACLCLSNSRTVNGTTLRPIERMEKLSYLNLSGTGLADSDLLAFDPPTGLKTLMLQRTPVSDTALAAFRRLHPDVTVIR